MTIKLDALRKMDRDLAQLECEVDSGDLDYVGEIQENLQTSLSKLLDVHATWIGDTLSGIKVALDAKNLEGASNLISLLLWSINALIEIEVQGAVCKSGGTHPIQPVEMVGTVARFKSNKIVRKLLDHCSAHGLDLNDLHTMGFSIEDHVQLAQLSGYSVCGAADLSYFPRDIIRKADAEVEKLLVIAKQ